MMSNFVKGSWPHLQSLSVYNITTDGLRTVAAAKWPMLQSLDLSMCQLEADLAALNKAPWLRALNLEQNNLGRQAGLALAKLHLPNLQHLNLGGNFLAELGALISANHRTKLLTLNLYRNLLGIKGVSILANVSWPLLHNLNLKGNNLLTEGANILADAELPALRYLFLRENHIRL
jgi:hypothetical protein